MTNRRKFLKAGLTATSAISLLPAVSAFADTDAVAKSPSSVKPKLRFALASDAHYGQPDTDSDLFFGDMIGWLNKEHTINHLDFVIINGDLVHDRPQLLPTVKSKFLDKLKSPYYTLPGNHDHADDSVWKPIFGYGVNYVIDKGDVGFVLAHTADTKGKYICPDVAFLKQALTAYANKPVVFVVLHIPPVTWMKEEPFLDCPEVMEVIGQFANVKALFHGHDHTLDGVRHSGKITHLFDAHIGGNWGTNYKGYRVVEVGEDNKIYTYQVNASQNPVLNSVSL